MLVFLVLTIISKLSLSLLVAVLILHRYRQPSAVTWINRIYQVKTAKLSVMLRTIEVQAVVVDSS